MNPREATERIERQEQIGMTLVEMLVVLAIIAVTASISVLAFGAGSGRTGQAEAKRLEARLQLAADRAMLDDEAIAILPQPGGYRFVQWNPESFRWQGASLAMLSEPHTLPRGMTLVASDARPLLPVGADNGGQAFALTISAEGRRWLVEFDGMTARTRPEGIAGS